MDQQYIIEELDSNDVPESELSEFQETEPIKISDLIINNEIVKRTIDGDGALIKEEINEGALIRQYVSGESSFPDMYTKLEPDELEDEDDRDGEKFISQGASQLLAYRVPDQGTSANDMSDDDIAFSSPRDSAMYNGGNRSRPRKRTVLNATLQGLMGEANLAFARGNVEMAEKICLEIVRQNPLASEPFFTLAEIYETRDNEKYMNFLTIAAHLNPGDRDQWVRLAEMHAAQGNLPRSRSLYSKAIKILSTDYDLRYRKGKILERMGDTNAAMISYLRMLPHVPKDRADLCLDTAKLVAQHFYKLQRFNLALEAMEVAYTVCAHAFSLEDLNMYLELLILNKSYDRVLLQLLHNTNFDFQLERPGDLSSIVKCFIPNNFVADIRVKVCIALVNVQAQKILEFVVENVHEHVPAKEGRFDLYVDLADALLNGSQYDYAEKLLRPVVSMEMKECPPIVWQRYAESLRRLERPLEAIAAYYRVLELAPLCCDAKFTLAALLKQQGRNLEAVKALEQTGGDVEGEPPNARMLYEQCLMLQQIGETSKYLEVGYKLLSRFSIKLRNREEMLAAAGGGGSYSVEGIKGILEMRNIGEGPDKTLQELKKSKTNARDLLVADEYTLFIELIRCAFQKHQHSYIQRLCFAMVTTKRFAPYHAELERIILLACYFNDDCAIAFSYLRELISKNVGEIALWNLLSLFIQKSHDLRYHRFVNRLVLRQPNTKNVRIFLAHYHLYCSSYKYALNEYVPLFKEHQQPMVALCIAIVFNQLSLQKRVLRKMGAVSQAIAFINKYAELRRAEASLDQKHDEQRSMLSAVEQEIFYNVGRMYQQSGLMHLAIESYERGLTIHHNEYVKGLQYTIGLQQEIAFNLHLIYRASGNLRKARQYLYQNCVI